MEIGKLLLVGAAGFVAYEYFTGAFSSPATAMPATGGIQPGPTPPVQPALQQALNPSTTQGLILAEAAKANFTRGSADQWNTFYKTVRGIDGPDPGSYLTPDTRAAILSFPEWFSLASSHGLSGTRGGYRRAEY